MSDTITAPADQSADTMDNSAGQAGQLSAVISTSLPATPVALGYAAVATDNDPNQCTYTTDSGRRCKLVRHIDAVKHKMVIRASKEEKKGLPAGFSLVSEAVKPAEVIAERGGYGRTAADRDEYQVKVDKDAAANYAKNKTAKNTSATDFASLVLSRFIVPPNAVDAVLDYLRKANTLGGPKELKGKVLRYRRGTHGSGNVQIQYAYVDKAPKTSNG